MRYERPFGSAIGRARLGADISKINVTKRLLQERVSAQVRRRDRYMHQRVKGDSPGPEVVGRSGCRMIEPRRHGIKDHDLEWYTLMSPKPLNSLLIALSVNGIRNPFGYQPWRDKRSFAVSTVFK